MSRLPSITPPLASHTAWLGRNAMGRHYVARQLQGGTWCVRDERSGAVFCTCPPGTGAGHPKLRAQKLARLLNGERS